MVKKFAVLGLSLVMCLSLCLPVAAVTNEGDNSVSQSYTASEYDILISLKEEKEALRDMPATLAVDEERAEYLEELQSFNPEEAIMEVASQPYDVLRRQGYSAEQIAILKAYDGGPIENNPQLSRALGELWATILRQSYSNHGAEARFSWKWTTKPIITGVFDDIVSCAWRGVNQDNEEVVMSFVSSSSECEVEYVTDMGATVDYVEYEINDKDPNRNAEVKFALSHNNGYAKEGYFDVCIEEEVIVNELATATFIFAYGHTNFTISPSISVSGSGPSLGLSCGIGTDEMFNEWMKINANGSTEVSCT